MSEQPQSLVDPAMLELFQAEMDTHIPVLNDGLLALEKGMAGAREIEAMMRAAHSIKGAARIVGIQPAIRLAHVMEDCFTAAKDRSITITPDSVDVLLRGVDVLQRICAPRDSSPVTEQSLQALLDQLTGVKSGKAQPPPAAVPGPPLPAIVEADDANVVLPAVFDDASIRTTRDSLLGLLARAPRRVVLDFAQVGDLSAAGLAVLVSFRELCTRLQPAPAIESRRIGPSVRMVLRTAGLHESYGLGG